MATFDDFLRNMGYQSFMVGDDSSVKWLDPNVTGDEGARIFLRPDQLAALEYEYNKQNYLQPGQNFMIQPTAPGQPGQTNEMARPEFDAAQADYTGTQEYYNSQLPAGWGVREAGWDYQPGAIQSYTVKDQNGTPITADIAPIGSKIIPKSDNSFLDNVFDVIGNVGPALVPSLIVPGFGAFAATGNNLADSAIRGAVNSALSGGDPVTGALTGGAGGFASPQVKSVLDSIGISDPTTVNAISNAVTSGLGSAIKGGDPLMGAAMGGINSLASNALGSVFPTKTDAITVDYGDTPAEWTSGYDVPQMDAGQSQSTSSGGWTSGYDLGSYPQPFSAFGGVTTSSNDPDAALIAAQSAQEQAPWTSGYDVPSQDTSLQTDGATQAQGGSMADWTSGYDVPSMDNQDALGLTVGDPSNNGDVLNYTVSDPASSSSLSNFLKSILGIGGAAAAGGAGSSGILSSLLGGSGGGALLGTLLGGLIGSQNGSKQSGTITTVQDVPEWMKPYYQTLYGTAQAQSQQANQLNPQEQQGIDAITQRATTGSPTLQAANSQVQKTLNGDYLDPSSNPWLQSAYDRGLGEVKKALTPSFGQMQAFGQNSGYNQALARGAADLATGIFGGNYQQERARQASAASQAPALASADYTDSTNLLNAGQYKRNAQQQGSTFMSGILNASPFRSSSQPTFSNPAAGLLGGALTGGILGKGIFG